jgi:hypothetical protein
MTFRMRSGAPVAAGPLLPPLASSKQFSGSAFPHVPADILSCGRARCSSSTEQTQRIEAQVKRCGEEDRHLRSSSLRLQLFVRTGRKWSPRDRYACIITHQETVKKPWAMFHSIENIKEL